MQPKGQDERIYICKDLLSEVEGTLIKELLGFVCVDYISHRASLAQRIDLFQSDGFFMLLAINYPQITGFFSLCDKDKPIVLYNALVTPLSHLKKF